MQHRLNLCWRRCDACDAKCKVHVPNYGQVITGFEPKENGAKGAFLSAWPSQLFMITGSILLQLLSNLYWRRSRRLRRKRQLVMHHVFNNLCLEYCTSNAAST